MSTRFALAALTVGAAAGGALAQTQPAWINTGYGGTGIAQIRSIQGGSQTGSFYRTSPSGASEWPMAVNSTVRTMPASPGSGGVEYSLTGTPTGNYYTNSTSDSFYAGTTDGTYNYAVNTGGSAIYRFNSDWSSPTVLATFGLGGSGGITYDSGTNSLWVGSGFTTNTFYNFDMSGGFLGTMSISGSSVTDLGYEASSDTFWGVHYDGSQRVTQYNRSGSVLTEFVPGGWSGSGADDFQIEFQPGVPAPSAMALLGLGGLAAARRRR